MAEAGAGPGAEAMGNGSAAFEWRGGRLGVLLVHGLTGTPSEMRFVGRGLHRAGFTVTGVQLAGHCGSADDLVATGWEDWYASVEAAALRLGDSVDRLFVAGLSMGALLALELAIRRPGLVSGLGLLGTTFRYDGWAVPRVARLSFLLPMATALGIGRRRMFMETFPYGIKNERIRNWVVGPMLAGDSQASGLPGNPWPSLAQLVLLSRRVRRRLPQVRAPCLAVHAFDDDVAGLGNVRALAMGVSGPFEQLLLKESYHMVAVDQERARVVSSCAEFFTRHAGPAAAPATPQPWAGASRARSQPLAASTAKTRANIAINSVDD